MPGDVGGHRRLDRSIEAVAAVMVADPAAMGLATAVKVSTRALAVGWLSDDSNLLWFGDRRRGDRIAVAAPNSGSDRHRVPNDDRPRHIDRFRWSEDGKIDGIPPRPFSRRYAFGGNTLAEPRLQLPIGERSVSPKKEPHPDAQLDSLAAGKRPPAGHAVELFG